MKLRRPQIPSCHKTTEAKDGYQPISTRMGNDYFQGVPMSVKFIEETLYSPSTVYLHHMREKAVENGAM